MGYQGKMRSSRSNYRSGYRKSGMTPDQEPNNRFWRRHGRFSELKLRTDIRKTEMRRKKDENPRLVRFNFLHHNL